MSATVMSESMVMSAAAAESPTVKKLSGGAQIDVESAKCDCCGLTEECTLAYIDRVRERYQGKWICGLCAEAIKDEIVRSEKRLISTDEALNRHMSFCKKFSSAAPPANPAVCLISAMRQILRRSLDSPRSMPSSPTTKNRTVLMARSESCIATLSLVDSSPYEERNE